MTWLLHNSLKIMVFWLKSALLECGVEPPHTHFLIELVRALESAGLGVTFLETLPLRALIRMAISSRYPLDAMPPSELFDQGETDAAIRTASAVIQILKLLDQD